MTNTESRIAYGLEELAPFALENEEQITEADIHELTAYAFDSDKQTLVGLGPVERAQRSLETAEIPDSERMPQSYSPGPFIAADEDDDDLLRSLRRPRLASWSLALPTLVVAVAAVAMVRGLAPQAPPAATKLAVAAVAPPATAEPIVQQAPAEDMGASEPRSSEPPPAVPPVAPRPATVNVPAALSASVVAVPGALLVKLPELPPPTVVDMSGGSDANAGTINVTSNPPSNVVLDGHPLGKAPRLIQVPVGIHSVVFIHPLYGRQSLSVNVSAGRTAAASADF